MTCVYRVAGTKILYAQGSQGNFLYEKILDRPGIEPVTLSMVMLNTRAFTASAIWALVHDSENNFRESCAGTPVSPDARAHRQ